MAFLKKLLSILLSGWTICSIGSCSELPSVPNCGVCVCPPAPTPPAICSQNCPDYLAPVCGVTTDGKQETFQNVCFFAQRVGCWEQYRNFRFFSSDFCPDDTSTTSTTTASPPAICRVRCPSVPGAVCAEGPKGQQKTFFNICALNQAIVCDPQYKDWFLLHEGQCSTPKPECPRVCGLIFMPVCAQSPDGQLQNFSNKCLLEEAVQCDPLFKDYIQISDKACPSPSSCGRICTQEFRPVCASGPGPAPNIQTKTFPNVCALGNAILCDPAFQGWGQICEGTCAKCLNAPVGSSAAASAEDTSEVCGDEEYAASLDDF